MEVELEISTDPARLDVGVVCEFLQNSYWASGRQRSVIERSMKNSLCFGAYLGGRQVAFARVVSDRAVFAYLMDVFVLPELRGRGISKALMRAILQHPDLQNLRVFLLATRDAHGLYSSSDFGRLRDPTAGWPFKTPIAIDTLRKGRGSLQPSATVSISFNKESIEVLRPAA